MDSPRHFDLKGVKEFDNYPLVVSQLFMGVFLDPRFANLSSCH